jgi:hypothetical protein
MCPCAGVEEYTPAHMQTLQPGRLGFGGRRGDQVRDDDETQARAEMAAFMMPLNEQLNQILSEHGMPWTAFQSAHVP